MTVRGVNDAVIRDAAAMLRAGECVAIPTETVYGLAADATNKAAVKKIFEIKMKIVPSIKRHLYLTKYLFK